MNRFTRRYMRHGSPVELEGLALAVPTGRFSEESRNQIMSEVRLVVVRVAGRVVDRALSLRTARRRAEAAARRALVETLAVLGICVWASTAAAQALPERTGPFYNGHCYNGTGYYTDQAAIDEHCPLKVPPASSWASSGVVFGGPSLNPPRDWHVLILTYGGSATILAGFTEKEARAVEAVGPTPMHVTTSAGSCLIITMNGACPATPQHAPDDIERIEVFR